MSRKPKSRDKLIPNARAEVAVQAIIWQAMR
jgi:hypothetical protein